MSTPEASTVPFSTRRVPVPFMMVVPETLTVAPPVTFSSELVSPNMKIGVL